jgi:hypothetical protein
VVFNGRIFHEAIKGIVNKRLFLEIEDKIFKDAIASFVEDIHDMARKFMWSERCKSFNEWELRQGITKQIYLVWVMMRKKENSLFMMLYKDGQGIISITI